jgi:heme/copper-type cytochrome/quinol oxidase subunit 3
MTTSTVIEDKSGSHHEQQHGQHDAYGDKFVAWLGLGTILFGLAIYNILKGQTTFGIAFGAAFLALLMIYFYYRASKPAYLDLTPNQNFQMWGFLASEVIFFSAIIGLSQLIHLREIALNQSWPAPGTILNVPVTAINTFILICSSLTMVLAQDAISKGNQKNLKIFLLATLVIGTLFLSIQVFEYNALIIEGHTADQSLFLATFYLQTGFHGFHVTIGVTALGGVFLAAVKGKFTQQNHIGIELMGLYWHFIDIVWVILFPIVYLI